MAEPDDVRRRVERLEDVQGTMQGIIRENSMQLARQNEILLELKEELKLRRQDLNEIHEIRLEVAELRQGFQIGGWVGKTIAGSALVAALAYLFRGHISL
jgi:hypothetical protein